MEEAPSLNAFKNPSALFATPWVFCYRGYKKNCRAGGNQHLSLNCFKPSFICICTCVNKPSISKAGSSVKQGLRVGESHFQSVWTQYVWQLHRLSLIFVGVKFHFHFLGDELTIVCASPHSYPAARLKFYINDEIVSFSTVTPVLLSFWPCC